eukprot:COSAG02_NODE_9278_length_2269_cov_1.312903_3_plen_112_part_00
MADPTSPILSYYPEEFEIGKADTLTDLSLCVTAVLTDSEYWQYDVQTSMGNCTVGNQWCCCPSLTSAVYCVLWRTQSLDVGGASHSLEPPIDHNSSRLHTQQPQVTGRSTA